MTISRGERLVPWLSGLALALPLLFVSFPPMADLPLHEVTVSLIRHAGDPTFWGNHDYRWNPGHPNQLFAFLAAALSFVLGVKSACLAVVVLSIVAIPVATGALASHLGRTRWTAALTAPLGLGWMFYWGLVANLLALPILLFALRALDKLAERPTRKNILQCCGWMILLYEAHEAMLVAACLATLVFLFSRRPTFRTIVLTGLPLGFAFAMAAAQVILQAKYMATADNAGKTLMAPFIHKIDTLSGVLFSGFEPFIRHSLFGLCVLAMLLFAWLRFREREAVSMGDRIFRLRFEIVAIALLVAYFVMPMNLNGATMVYHRFLPPAWSILAACAGPRPQDLPRLPRFASLVAPIGSLLISWPNLLDASQMYGDAQKLLPAFQPGSTILTIDLGPRRRMFASSTFGAHFVAMKGGRSWFDFTQSTISPVVLNMDCWWDDLIQRIGLSENMVRPAHDFKMFRYVLVHATEEAFLDASIIALGKYSTPVAREGEWLLLESKSFLPGLCAKEVELPTTGKLPATFRDLLGNVLRKAAQANADRLNGSATSAKAIGPDSEPALADAGME